MYVCMYVCMYISASIIKNDKKDVTVNCYAIVKHGSCDMIMTWCLRNEINELMLLLFICLLWLEAVFCIPYVLIAVPFRLSAESTVVCRLFSSWSLHSEMSSDRPVLRLSLSAFCVHYSFAWVFLGAVYPFLFYLVWSCMLFCFSSSAFFCASMIYQ